MQQLAGLLNFLNKAIHPGHAFTRRMYSKYSDLQTNKKLKQHHHINLDSEFRSDCGVWLSFLEKGKQSVCRPFVDLVTVLSARDLSFYTDSAAGAELGFGGIYNKRWFFGKWETRFIESCKPSIAFLELFALCMGVHIWETELTNMRCILYTDNESVVQMVNNTSSSCKQCMKLIRMLTLKGLKINSRFFA